MQDLELQAIQEFAKSDLISFCVYMNPDYVPQPFHIEIAKKLEDVFYGRINRLIINVPPRHGKSEIVSKMFPIWCLGKNPKTQFVMASYTAELAQYFSKSAIEKAKSQEYKSLFNLDLISEGVQHRETKQGGYYHAAGVSGSMTGFGFDIGIIDDPLKDRQDAESPVIRGRMKDRYTSTFNTRQGKNAAIIVIQTRWHIDDLTGWLESKESEGGDKREKLVLPALSKDNIALRESKYGYDWLMRQKAVVGVRDFAALYQQDPITSTGQIFKPHYFKYCLLSDFETGIDQISKKAIKTGIFIDPAFSSSSKSDDAVVIFGGQHEITKKYYTLDVYADTSAPSQTIKAIFDMAEKWEYSYGFDRPFISIERVAINKQQDKFIEDLKAEMRFRGKEYKIIEYRPTMKKMDRIKYWLEPPLFNGNLHFMKHYDYGEGFRKLEEQLLMFPSSNHDDVADCQAQMINVFENQARGINVNKTVQNKPRQYRSPELGKMITI